MSIVTSIADRLRKHPLDSTQVFADDLARARKLVLGMNEPEELYEAVNELFELALWFDRNEEIRQAEQLLNAVLLPATLRLSGMTVSARRLRERVG